MVYLILIPPQFRSHYHDDTISLYWSAFTRLSIAHRLFNEYPPSVIRRLKEECPLASVYSAARASFSNDTQISVNLDRLHLLHRPPGSARPGKQECPSSAQLVKSLRYLACCILVMLRRELMEFSEIRLACSPVVFSSSPRGV